MINTEVHPTLTGDLALPVATRVIVDEFLFLGHPKQPMELNNGFFKLLCVIIFLHIVDFVILCNDALSRMKHKAHHWCYYDQSCFGSAGYIYRKEKIIISKARIFLKKQ